MPDAGRRHRGHGPWHSARAPPEGTRPLTDRVKQSLFAAWRRSGALDGPFLDLFAGSGAAGIEALSRGAPVPRSSSATARPCASSARTCAARTSSRMAHVVRADVVSFLAAGSAETRDAVHARRRRSALRRRRSSNGRWSCSATTSARWLLDDALVVAKHFWGRAAGAVPAA